MMPPGMRILPGGPLRRPRRRVVHPEADADRGDRLEQIRAPRALRRAGFRFLTQRRHVVEDPEAAAVRAGDEVGAQTRAVVLELEIAHRDRRHVEAERFASGRRRRTTPTPARRSPRTSSPFFLGSSRIEFAAAPPAMPVLISVHVLPPSCVRQKCGLASSMRSVFAAAYAVMPSKCPASMLKMRVHGLIAGGVTFVHVAPPSIVTWILPSSVPAQIVLMSRGDGESAVMLPSGAGVDDARVLAGARRRLPRLPREIGADARPAVRVIGRLPHRVRRVEQHVGDPPATTRSASCARCG